MAFPVVETTAISNDNVASATVTFPSGIVDGDLLVGITQISSDDSITYPGGWTLADTLTDGGNVRSSVWYRQADGTESGTFTVTIGDSENSIHMIYRISGADLVATQAPEADHFESAATALPDPPNLNPAGGTKDFLWLSGMFIRNLGGSVPPSGFGSTLIRAVGTGHGATAQRNLSAGSLNPSTWDATPSSPSWVASTIAIHPASGPTVDSISPNTGPDTGQTVVTITGSLFVDAPTVTVGGTAALSVVFNNSTSLTIVTPAGTIGPQDVVVTNPAAQADTLAGGFIYTGTPSDIITLNCPTVIRRSRMVAY